MIVFVLFVMENNYHAACPPISCQQWPPSLDLGIHKRWLFSDGFFCTPKPAASRLQGQETPIDHPFHPFPCAGESSELDQQRAAVANREAPTFGNSWDIPDIPRPSMYGVVIYTEVIK